VTTPHRDTVEHPSRGVRWRRDWACPGARWFSPARCEPRHMPCRSL